MSEPNEPTPRPQDRPGPPEDTTALYRDDTVAGLPVAPVEQPVVVRPAEQDEPSTGDYAKDRSAEVAEHARDRAEDVSESAKQNARAVADTAKEDASHVAGVAKEEARQVADEAGRHARSLFAQARDEVTATVDTQQHQVAATFQRLGEGLSDVSFGDEPADQLARDLTRQASDGLRGAGSWLDSRGPAEVLDEVARFARRRPGTFLAAAALTGFVAGRLTRSLADDARRDDEPAGRRADGGAAHHTDVTYRAEGVDGSVPDRFAQSAQAADPASPFLPAYQAGGDTAAERPGPAGGQLPDHGTGESLGRPGAEGR